MIRISRNLKSANEVLEEKEPIQVVEISGMDPRYEDACQTICLRVWKWLEDNNMSRNDVFMQNKIEPGIERKWANLCSDIDPSGAMFHHAVAHALYIRKYGYAAWLNSVEEDRIKLWKPHYEWGEKRGEKDE